MGWQLQCFEPVDVSVDLRMRIRHWRDCQEEDDVDTTITLPIPIQTLKIVLPAEKDPCRFLSDGDINFILKRM